MEPDPPMAFKDHAWYRLDECRAFVDATDESEPLAAPADVELTAGQPEKPDGLLRRSWKRVVRFGRS